MVLAGQMRCSSVLKEEWTYLRVFSLIKWQSGDAPWLSALITSRILKRHVGLLKLISVSPLNSFYFLSAFGLSHKPEICTYCKASLWKLKQDGHGVWTLHRAPSVFGISCSPSSSYPHLPLHLVPFPSPVPEPSQGSLRPLKVITPHLGGTGFSGNAYCVFSTPSTWRNQGRAQGKGTANTGSSSASVMLLASLMIYMSLSPL